MSEITHKDLATPVLTKLVNQLTDRTGLHKSIATQAANVTRDYLIGIAGKRHKTADRLGANPTGHLERAAQSVSSEANAEEAIIGVTSPGMSRALEDLTIKPKNRKYLTIPATAEAYGRRAGSFNDLRLAVFGKTLALVKAEQSSLADRKRSGFSVDKNNLRAPMKDAGKGVVYYWLVKSVFQKQDRTLLPSDDLYKAAAEEGAVSYLEMLIEAGE
jgi:hypothetical protein